MNLKNFNFSYFNLQWKNSLLFLRLRLIINQHDLVQKYIKETD